MTVWVLYSHRYRCVHTHPVCSKDPKFPKHNTCVCLYKRMLKGTCSLRTYKTLTHILQQHKIPRILSRDLTKQVFKKKAGVNSYTPQVICTHTYAQIQYMKMCKRTDNTCHRQFIMALTGIQMLKALFTALKTEPWGATQPEWQRQALL